MLFSNRKYLMFLISIVAPGLFLGYLSFKTIQNEKALISRSIKTERTEFLSYIENILQKTEAARMKEIQDLLIQSSSSANLRNYFFLISELLHSPMIHSVLVLEQGAVAFPAPESNQWIQEGPGGRPQKTTPARLLKNAEKIQYLYKKQNYRECVKLSNRFLADPGSLKMQGGLGTNFHYGISLLKINCLRALGNDDEAIQSGIQLVDGLLSFQAPVDYRQLQFFLQEVLSILSAVEHLPSDVRDEIWDISTRLDGFFSNAERVHMTWRLDTDFLEKIRGKEFTEGMEVFNFEGNAFLKIKFPWVDTRTQVIARLNETLFIDLLRQETIDSPGSPWKQMEYAVYSLNNAVVFAPFGTESKTPAVERVLNVSLPQWKMAVFDRTDSQRLKIAERKIIILFVLLLFSGCVLIIGAFSTIRGIINENRIIRMKSNFLSAVTHELKTPLTSIRVLSELMASGRQSDSGKIVKYASMIRSEANRLQTMIENVLNSVRLENRRAIPLSTPVNLSELIGEIIAMMHNSFQEKKIALEHEISGSISVKGDREALRSVVQNLLDNALKYSPSETLVHIRLTRSGSEVQLRIKDQGIGISQGDLKNIFQRFFRAGDEMTRKTKGTGLGLALVKQILDQHGAKILVNSEVSKGTEFVVFFKGEE